MPATGQPPLQLTIRRQGDAYVVDLDAGEPLIPQSEAPADAALLRGLVAQFRLLATFRGIGDDRGGSVATNRPGAVVQDLERIGSLIFSQLLPGTARQRLLTAPSSDLYLRLDEQLIHVPWELCYDGTDFLATKFCIGRQVITNAPVPERRKGRAETGPLRVLLIADPTEDLPQAADEGEQLCTLLDGVSGVKVKLLEGRFANKAHLFLDLQAYDIVHFAGHSHYDPERPEKSGWHLHEGILTTGELSKLSTPPLLVFSNSCQAGATPAWGGRYQYDGQAFGIGSAFLLAGVTNYIGTFWVVHDEESRIFAVAFYQGIAAGLSVGGALLHARLRARQEVQQQKGWEGLTWASYMLYGDPTVTLFPAAPAVPVKAVALPIPTTVESVDRQLVAILSADVEGYSRHMNLDDVATVQTLNTYRQVMTALIETQRGEVIDSPGDNMLAIFPSVVGAVQCAVEIQRELKARNDELPAHRQLRFRIGINLGDVLRQEEGIHGDGINIAARLEKLAPPGGVCISGFVYEQVKNRLHPLALEYKYLGERRLKNIAKPVPAYQVWTEPTPLHSRFFQAPRVLYEHGVRHLAAIVWVAGGVLTLVIVLRFPRPEPLPEPPEAVVVMPFEVLSPASTLGVTPEAILHYFNSQLSGAPHLKVYSKEHFDFEVQTRKTAEIAVAKQLSIAKMIYGSVFAFGTKLRIEAHVNDVQSGALEASEVVEGELGDFFTLIQDLTEQVMKRLNVPVPVGRPGGAPPPSTPSLDTYKLLLEGEGETPAVKPHKEEGAPSQHPLHDEGEKRSWILPLQEWFAPGTAWADDTSPQGVSREDEVRRVLEQYRQAYEKKDPDLLAAVYEAFTPAQREANAKYFENTRDLRVTLRDIDITVRGDEAAVSYTREDEFTDAKTGQKVKLDVRFTKIFVRADSTWKMGAGKK